MTSSEYDSVEVDELLQDAPAHVVGLVDLIKRTGAYSMQMREVDDPAPTVWVVVTTHYLNEDGFPCTDTDAELHVEAAAAQNLGTALKRMTELLMDGGMCVKCNRPTLFYALLDGDVEFLRQVSCVTYWNGEQFVKSCQEEMNASR